MNRQKRMGARLESLASSDVSLLQQTILDLQAKLEEVQAENALEIEVPDLSNAESHIQLVYDKLGKQRISDLRRVYTNTYFKPYSAYVRYVIASALVKLARDKDSEPSELWLHLQETLGKL